MDISKVDSNVTPVSQTQKSNDIWSVNNKGVFAGGQQKITFEKMLKDAQASQVVPDKPIDTGAGTGTTNAPSAATVADEPAVIVNKRENVGQPVTSNSRDIWSVNNRGVFVAGEQKITFEQLSSQANIETPAPTVTAPQESAQASPLIESAQAQEIAPAVTGQVGAQQTQSGKVSDIWSVNNKGVFVNGEQKMTYQQQVSAEPAIQTPVQTTPQPVVPRQTQSQQVLTQAPQETQNVQSAGQENQKTDIWAVNNRGVLVNGQQGIVPQQPMSIEAPVENQRNIISVQEPVTAPAVETNVKVPQAAPVAQAPANDIWSVNNNGLFVNGQQKLTYEQLQMLKTADSLSTQPQPATQETNAPKSSDVIFSQTYDQRVEKEDKNIFQKMLEFFNIK